MRVNRRQLLRMASDLKWTKVESKRYARAVKSMVRRRTNVIRRRIDRREVEEQLNDFIDQ
jgi:hypothetical protein